uniref:Transcription termination factor NusG n=1 Tax=Escherichia coli TaxID=562 RepID=A0A3G4RTG2_ECOLX|nr:hypothetical protein D0368_00205 [Escherichia coli]
MNIEHLNNRNWYLAQYNTAGKNRESLFSWLNEQNVVPWTPLITRKIRRADSRCCYRERIFAIFPGYFLFWLILTFNQYRHYVAIAPSLIS